jgi:antitoxin (DNA-binding transcriptional repressor) of toxin-antitoxin stability system
VAQGETIEITDRGRPVALLAPLPDTGPLERLRAGGQIDEATGNLDDLPDPLIMPAGSTSASATLGRLREAER